MAHGLDDESLGGLESPLPSPGLPAPPQGPLGDTTEGSSMSTEFHAYLPHWEVQLPVDTWLPRRTTLPSLVYSR